MDNCISAGDYIRDDVKGDAGPHVAGTATRADDLIGDHQNSMLIEAQPVFP